MSLQVIVNARIEDLAEKLLDELKTERAAKGPFEFLNVAVANPNLGNWLKIFSTRSKTRNESHGM